MSPRHSMFLKIVFCITVQAALTTESLAQNPIPRGDKAVRLEIVGSGMYAGIGGGPLQITPSDIVPDGLGRMFVATQGGYIRMIDSSGSLLPTPFMTAAVSGTTALMNKYGMTGMAVHPDFSTVGSLGYGKFYTITTEPADIGVQKDFGFADAHQEVIKEWTMNNINDNVFAGTMREVVRFGQTNDEHNVNDMTFDANGYLYIALGDDFQGNQGSQNVGSAFGKILKIDPLNPTVSSATRGAVSGNGKYRVPTDNPFFSTAGAVKEVYAYGLRNPYRLNFDSATGDLWVGDVGRTEREEVNLVQPGANYGWTLREGTTGTQPPGGSVDPVFEYTHGDGVVVVGGFVYRGSEIADSVGDYIFADYLGQFVGGRLFYGDPATGKEFEFILDPKGDRFNIASAQNKLITERVFTIGEDENGELYIGMSSLTGPTATKNGWVARILPALLGDFDDDKIVDGDDLAAWEAGAGTVSGASPDDGDADGDGDVDGTDFLRWQREVGQSLLQTPAVAEVPEPASLAMMLIAAGMLAYGKARSKRRGHIL